MNLSDLYRCDGRLGLARDRNGRSGQPVGEQLLGVVFSDGCGLRDRRDPDFGTGEQGDRGDRDNGYNSGQSSRWAENKREEIERSARAPLALARINPLRIKRTTTSRSESVHLRRWSIPKDHDHHFPSHHTVEYSTFSAPFRNLEL